MENPLVSIVMPAYNSMDYIEESIDSVLSQTYKNWELLLVDDGSNDNTASLALRYAQLDSRIKVFTNSPNEKGVSGARNLGLLNAKGRFISFLDSDDIWQATKLEMQISIMLKHQYHVCHSSYYRVDKWGVVINEVKCNPIVTYRDQLKSNYIPNLTGIYDRESLGLVLQKRIGHEDYDMWLNILYKSPSIGVTQPLAKYRVSGTSLSSNKLKSALWHYKILCSQSNIGFFSRIYYLFSYVYFAIAKRF